MPALFLQVARFGKVIDELVAEAAFLDAEIVELAVVREKGLGFDEGGANREVLFGGELGGKLDAAQGVDAGFECEDVQNLPFGVGCWIAPRRVLRRSLVGGCRAYRRWIDCFWSVFAGPICSITADT